ncbi:hypothetical protein GCM10020254_14150 [Streptomyces goshikiensis]
MSTSSHEMFGAPCWVSLMARDLASAQEFYGAVLGWEFRPTRLGEQFSVAMYEGCRSPGSAPWPCGWASRWPGPRTSPWTTRT